MDIDTLAISGLPHQYFQKVLPSKWSMDTYERHDRNAQFQAYVSPIGTSYQSFSKVVDELNQTKNTESSSILTPDEFHCPVTHEKLVVPFLRADGHTYEKESGFGLVENKLLHALIADFGKFVDGVPKSRAESSVSEVRRKSREAVGALEVGRIGKKSESSHQRIDSSSDRQSAKRWSEHIGQDSRCPPNKYIRNAEADKSSSWAHTRKPINESEGSRNLTYFEEGRPREERLKHDFDARKSPRGESCRSPRDDIYRPVRSEVRITSEIGAKELRLNESRPTGESRDHRNRRDEVWNPRPHSDVKRDSYPHGSQIDTRHPSDDRMVDSRLCYPVSTRDNRPFFDERQHGRYVKDVVRSHETATRDLDKDVGSSGARAYGENDDKRGIPKGSLQSERRLGELSSPRKAASPSTPRTPLFIEFRELVTVETGCSLQVLKKKLLGPNHEHINHIEEECGVQLRLRGTHPPNDEMGEPLHFLIKAKTDAAIQSARSLIRDLIKHTL